MSRKPKQKMQNPMGMTPNFTGIGQPPPITFNNDDLESELLDLLGEGATKPMPKTNKAPKKRMDARMSNISTFN